MLYVGKIAMLWLMRLNVMDGVRLFQNKFNYSVAKSIGFFKEEDQIWVEALQGRWNDAHVNKHESTD